MFFESKRQKAGMSAAFCGDDVTNPHRMPVDRHAVIDVQNAIKKRGC
jgi:hypothetical protein